MLEAIIGKPAATAASECARARHTRASARRKRPCARNWSSTAPTRTAPPATPEIDPLGIAFDNYDAIGRWRTVETIKDGTGADPTLDPSGTLPDGRSFANATDLKRILVTDSGKFASAFTAKLATALRRGMTFSDREELKRITDEAKAGNYQLRSLIESLVASPLFVKR